MTDSSARPKRIQRKRTKGWKMPKGAIYVGRPTPWGNPFAVNEPVERDSWLWPYAVQTLPEIVPEQTPMSQIRMSRISMLRAEDVVEAFTWWLIEQPHLMCSLDELAGRDLACWCPLGRPCHADVLLELANHDGGDV